MKAPGADGSEVAIQYVRRSSDKQEESLEQQGRLIAEFIAKKGYAGPSAAHLAVWSETGSGRTFDERPVFQRLIHAVETGAVVANVLVMYRPNRFGRVEEITEFHFYEFRFKRAGVRIEFASGDEYNLPGIGGHITRAVAYGQASEYSKNLSTDSTRGLIDNAEKGFSTGGEPCTGYDRMLVDQAGKHLGLLPPGARKGDDRRLKVVYVPTANTAFLEWFRENVWLKPWQLGWGSAQTAREINRRLLKGEGFPPTRAGRQIHRRDGNVIDYGDFWQPSTVVEMWHNTTYIGWRTLVIEADNQFHGQRVCCKGAHDAVIPEDVFWDLYGRSDRLPWKERKLGPRRRREPGKYPLSGLGTCTSCGRGLCGSCTTNKVKNSEFRAYRCSGETNSFCRAPAWSVSADTFDTWVRERVVERLRSPHFAETLYEKLRARLKPDTEPPPRAGLERRLNELDRGIDNLLDVAARAARPSAALAKRLDELEAERARLEADLGAVAPSRPQIVDEDLRRAVEDITSRAEVLLRAEGETLAALAPCFIKQYRVDKTLREITVEFYAVPGFEPSPNPGTRIDRMEAARVELASEAPSDFRDTWPAGSSPASVVAFGHRQSPLLSLRSPGGCSAPGLLRI